MGATNLPLIAIIAMATATSALFVAAGAAKFARWERRARLIATGATVLVHAALLAATPESLIASNAIVSTTAIAIGTLIGSSVRERNALIALAIAASIADIVSFSAGPSRWLLERGSGGGWSLLNYLMISIPWAERIIPVVGIGDLMFMAAFFLALRRLGAPRLAAVTVPLAGLLVALAVGLAAGGAWAIPFMSATTIAYALRR